jgi:hypothetical protein
MNPIEVLHNAARHCCTEQSAHWHREYAQLAAAGRERTTIRSGNGEYTKEAYGIFPRYQVLAAILGEVERFVPADFRSLEESRSLLALAGETAESQFTKYQNPVAVQAVQDERRRFVEFIRSADVHRLAGLPLLPFRRALVETEHCQLHASFRRRWGSWYGGFVDPANYPIEAVTLHVAAMDTPDAYDNLRCILRDQGIKRLLELREWGEGHELETADATFTYNGAEGFWTSGEMGWMIYASHESSITFGSPWLIDGMRRCLPSFDGYLYRGWDLTVYEIPPLRDQ